MVDWVDTLPAAALGATPARIAVKQGSVSKALDLTAEGIADAAADGLGERDAGRDAAIAAAAAAGQRTLTPEMFGAIGDRSQDDTSAINAAFSAAIETPGMDVLLTRQYRVTGTLRVGPPIVGSGFCAAVIARTAPSDFAAHFTYPLNVDANMTKAAPVIRFTGNACIVADFAPETPTPVIEYNIPSGRFGATGGVVGARIYSPGSINASGIFDFNAEPAVATNLVGIVFPLNGPANVHNIHCAGLGAGVISNGHYWSTYKTLRFDNCTDGLHVAQGNALNAENLLFYHCVRGLIHDGDAAEFVGVHTEHCLEDVVMLGGFVNSLRNAYLEDTGNRSIGGSGAGKYAVKLGMASGSTAHQRLRMENVMVVATRSDKKSFRLWGLNDATIQSCMAFGNGVVADSTSTGTLTNTDFPTQADLPYSRWMREEAGGSLASVKFPGSEGRLIGKYGFLTPYFDKGTVSAYATYGFEYEYTFPNSFVLPAGTPHIVAVIHSGGDDRINLVCRLKADRTAVIVNLANPADTPIAFAAALYLSVELWA